jgi:hypothetical protein
MIKINDLRQGNLVQTSKGEVIEWDWTLLASGIDVWIRTGGSEVIVDPVEITDEWLERMGITSGHPMWGDGRSLKLKLYKNYIRDGSGRFEGVTFSQYIGQITEHSIRNVCCRYVHELQNFYYTFTKEELKIPER